MIAATGPLQPGDRSSREIHAIATSATLVMSEDNGTKAKYPDYVTNILEPTSNKAFLGDLTPEQFVDEMVSQTKNYWASK